jgi:hypothetical protein
MSRLFIDGEWQDAASGATFTTLTTNLTLR